MSVALDVLSSVLGVVAAPPSRTSVVLDLLSSALGFASAVLLLITPMKGVPYRRTIVGAEKLDPKGILFDLAQKDADVAKRQLANIMTIEPNLLRCAGACLCGSFVLALGKHLF